MGIGEITFDIYLSLLSIVNRQRPKSHISHSMLATPSSAPTRDVSEVILHLATAVRIEIEAGIRY